MSSLDFVANAVNKITQDVKKERIVAQRIAKTGYVFVDLLETRVQRIFIAAPIFVIP